MRLLITLAMGLFIVAAYLPLEARAAKFLVYGLLLVDYFAINLLIYRMKEEA